MRARRTVLVLVCAAALCAAGYAAAMVSQHAIDVAASRRLLPRWDLAAHLTYGRLDAAYLQSLHVHRLLEDLWLQGYWPPVPSLFQMPFYVLLGGEMTSGLRSSLLAFVLSVAAGSALLGLQWTRAALLPAALFVTFMVTSPFYLAYASVAMTEMLGVLAQLCVLVAHRRYEERRTPAAARTFAISLTVLFFTKYNYFLMLAVPLVVHEYLQRTAGWPLAVRLQRVRQWTGWWLTTPVGALLTVYVAAVLAVTLTGGFAFSVWGRRVAVGTIGNSGYVALYLGLARLWFLHRRGRVDWPRLCAADPRVRPLLQWLVLPVTVWLASPYPNHIKDAVALVINAPMGAPTVGTGLAVYGAAIRADYFAHDGLLALAVVGFALAALRFRSQPPCVQLVILAASLQLAMVFTHHTRLTRFLALPVSLVCLAGASELGLRVWRRGPLVAGLAAPALLVYALVTTQAIVRAEPFRRLAFEHYVDSPALDAALASLRDAIGPGERVAVLGRSDALSPGLLAWHLGVPAGERFPPFEIVKEQDVALLDRTTSIVLIAPTAADLASPEITRNYARHASRLQPWLDAGTFGLSRELPVDDLHVALRFYRLTTAPPDSDRRRFE